MDTASDPRTDRPSGAATKPGLRCTSPNWTTSGHYAFNDRAQNTTTTIGTGSGNGTVSVTIRDEAAQQELEDSGQTAGVDEINSDLDTAQVITKDELKWYHLSGQVFKL